MTDNNPNNRPTGMTNDLTHGRDYPDQGSINSSSSTRFDNDAGSATGTVISAIFDTHDEAREAIADLRRAGIDDASMSLLTQQRGTTTTSNADGDTVDEEHTSYLRGIFGGGALGAGLGVAALAIPGVGPLIAGGAIAAAAIPGALAAGAAVGATFGSVNEALKSHGLSDEDAEYYGGRMNEGGVLVTVHPDGAGRETDRVRDILHANGGHNASRAKPM